ncbi:MAG: hypothetical protein HY744_11100 [Deltaproteobacteria bacterium]|nr:hypothetical protein [Deltaproteobacteria bacterium]
MRAQPAAPDWRAFHVLKAPRRLAELSGLYCLAAATAWLARSDPKPLATAAVIEAMLKEVPSKSATTAVNEKTLRQAGKLYGVHMYRPNLDTIWTLDWPADWIWLAAVRGLPVPGRREPPIGRRHVLVLGYPDSRGVLIGDAHPGTPAKFRVSIDQLTTAWTAGRTRTHKPWAAVIGRREP